MSVSRRYHPEIAPGETSVFGFDFSPVIPVGVGIKAGTLDMARTDGGVVDIDASAVTWIDRTLYATLTSGLDNAGFDYQLTWTATDTDGNVWPRTAMLLCALTS
ncbi:MAG TPA: hypothetical protein VKP67_14645 [Xanthobacteraceae bacterium]|nr:hypothetical protein [Xanthobacteraceae bacterium]